MFSLTDSNPSVRFLAQPVRGKLVPYTAAVLHPSNLCTEKIPMTNITRRDFLRACISAAALAGLPSSMRNVLAGRTGDPGQ